MTDSTPKEFEGSLFVVGTPIGNLEDVSPRVLKTLENVDFIAAEDTRVTSKLLNRFSIKKPAVSYHQHNMAECGNKIIERIINGESCAIVTDAGMPAISDPGAELVKACHERGIKVVCVPGPSAVVSAAAMSGLNVTRFTFEGFLSVNKPSRAERLEELKDEKRTMIFYEAPHKIRRTLNDFFKTFGNRKIAIIKELTKIHENVTVTTLEQARHLFRERPKGEFVIVLEGKEEKVKTYTQAQQLEIAKKYIEEGFGINEASKRAAIETGAKKGDIYSTLLKERLNDTNEKEDGDI